MTAPHPEKRQLGSWTWREAAAEAPQVLLVPVGSCEQHGPHLPLDTDTRIATAVAERAAAAAGVGVVVAPPVAYGSSGEHQGFPGTLSIGTGALRAVLVELGRSAFPSTETGAFASVVFVNGHGGNHEALRGAVDLLRAEGRPVSAWWPTIASGDAHAGRTETSLLLAIAGDAVGAERPVGATEPIEELLTSLRSGGVAAVASNGVLGDATGATAEEGAALLAALVDDLGARLAVS